MKALNQVVVHPLFPLLGMILTAFPVVIAFERPRKWLERQLEFAVILDPPATQQRSAEISIQCYGQGARHAPLRPWSIPWPTKE